MIGTKIYKEYIENPDGGLGFWNYDEELYFKCSCWCNENGNLTIEDKGEYYEVVEIPLYIPSNEEIKASLLKAVDNYMDTTVQKRGYDNIAKCVTYEGDIDHIFNREGTMAKQWRSKVYRTCYNILAGVEAGYRPIPTEAELLAELPKIDWGD